MPSKGAKSYLVPSFPTKNQRVKGLGFRVEGLGVVSEQVSFSRSGV